MKRKQEDAKQPAAAGDSPYLDSSLNTLAALRNVERKQRRKLGKALVQKLDATLPQHYSSQPTLNGAGGRSLGSKGRSLHDVLTDAIKVVQAARDGQAPAPAGARRGGRSRGAAPKPGGARSALEVGAVMRDGFFASDTLFCIEVQVPDDWRIVRVGRGAESFFEHAPWGCCVGQSFVHAFVHTEDVGICRAAWQDLARQREGAARHGAPPSARAKDGFCCTVTVRVLNFQRLSPVAEVQGLGRDFTASEFVSMEMQLIAPPAVPGAGAGAGAGARAVPSVLVVASLDRAMVVPQVCVLCAVCACSSGSARGHGAHMHRTHTHTHAHTHTHTHMHTHTHTHMHTCTHARMHRALHLCRVFLPRAFSFASIRRGPRLNRLLYVCV